MSWKSESIEAQRESEKSENRKIRVLSDRNFAKSCTRVPPLSTAEPFEVLRIQLAASAED